MLFVGAKETERVSVVTIEIALVLGVVVVDPLRCLSRLPPPLLVPILLALFVFFSPSLRVKRRERRDGGGGRDRSEEKREDGRTAVAVE